MYVGSHIYGGQRSTSGAIQVPVYICLCLTVCLIPDNLEESVPGIILKWSGVAFIC